MVVNAAAGAAGAPDDVEHPAVHTTASMSRVRNKNDVLLIIVFILFLYPDNCYGLPFIKYENESENSWLWQTRKKKEKKQSLLL
jgi:hypothetical protein